MWQGRSWRAGLAVAGLLAGLGVVPLAAAETAPAGPPAAGAKADAAPIAAAWQKAITGQVEAFRRADAVTAFSYAGAPFRKAFPDATTFMLSVAAAGYGPIFTSVSYSFGEFQQLDPANVVQQVRFVGPNGEAYVAVYVLALEPAGWRIEGVQLAADESIGV